MIDLKSKTPEKKFFNDDDLVCHCFGHTKKDIEKDYSKNGTSLIYEKIVSEKKDGGCRCASMNPSGK